MPILIRQNLIKTLISSIILQCPYYFFCALFTNLMNFLSAIVLTCCGVLVDEDIRAKYKQDYMGEYFFTAIQIE